MVLLFVGAAVTLLLLIQSSKLETYLCLNRGEIYRAIGCLQIVLNLAFKFTHSLKDS